MSCRLEMKVGYAGQRYEASCRNGKGQDLVLGWTNEKDGGVFKQMVEKHPAWHSLRVAELSAERRMELTESMR